MSARLRFARRGSHRRAEDGFTLVEVLISVVLLSLITGAMSAAFVTALNVSRPTSARVRESNDAQLIAAFLVRDAQAAGGTNPFTGAADDASLGVSTTDISIDGNPCTSTINLVASFKWIDQTTLPSTMHVAVYSYVPGTTQLVRKTCVGTGALGAPTPLTLGKYIASAPTFWCTTNGATVPCSTGGAPTTMPDSVSMTVTETNNPQSAPSAYTYTLTASLRPQSEDRPCAVGSPGCTNPGAAIPLILLGGGGCVDGTSGLDVGGSVQAHVYGDVLIDATSAGAGCPAFFYHLGSQGTYGSGDVSILNGGTCPGCPFSTTGYSPSIADPFAGLPTPPGVPSGACTGSNPAPTGIHYHPGVYPNLLSISGGNAVFDAGTYIFCNGLNITGGTITNDPAGVLLYFKGGTFTKSGGTTVDLSAPTSGTYTGLVVWQAAADTTTPMSLTGNGHLTLAGTLYAPSIEVILGGTAVTSVQAVIANTVSFQGNHSVGVGIPPPTLSITGPGSLPNWTANQPYPDTTITTTGGTNFKTFTATGLPAGLVIDAPTGLIHGTPTGPAGSYAIAVGVKDSAGDIDSVTYTVTIGGPLAITGPATLTDWTINRDYPGTAIIAGGGTTPYAWSDNGTLPPGLSINAATGVVSSPLPTGPTATGTFTTTITLTDAAGASVTKNYTIQINSPPQITGPGTLPDWTVGQAYPSQTMTRSNGTAPYTWAASGLPTGLVINVNTGVISGTPTAAGTFSVSVTLKDKSGASDTHNYPDVTINPVLGIATASLPNAEVGKAYNFTLTPTPGGTPPYTWSLVSAPAWLTINANTGKLSGTPPATGAPNVTVRLTDSAGATATKTYTLTIAAAVTISGPATIPNWTINRDYPGTAIIVGGGVSPFTWSATGLPAGLTINPGTGVITGTPSAIGTSNVTVTVQDAYGVTDPQTYTVTINALPQITTSSPLPNGEQTVFYSTGNSATLGTPAYTWALSGLPVNSGLSINSVTGVLSGTPNVSGTFTVTVTATDVAGASASKDLSLTLTPGPSVTSTSLAAATRNQTGYSQTLTSTGGTGTITWTLQSGSLPTGLGLSAGGVISGNVGAGATTQTFTVAATDANGAVATQSLTITVNAAPSVTSTSLAAATRNQIGYSQTLTSTGGTGTITWTLQSGSLPTGLGLSAGGVISGNVGAGATTQTFTVAATDTNGVTGTKSLTITVNAAPSVSTTTLPNATQTQTTYSQTLTSTGGTGAITWSLQSGSLPTGLGLSAGGVISGNVGAGATTQTFTVAATDTNGVAGTKSLTITVNPRPTITSISPNSRPAGASGPETIAGTGFVSGATVTFSPAGAKSPSASNIVVNGPGTQITFTVTNGNGSQAKGTYDVTVTNPDGSNATLTGSFTVT